jgi:hypothetical protein
MLREWMTLSLVSIVIAAVGVPASAAAWLALALIGF